MQAERKSNNISPSNGPVCSSTKWAFMKPDWRFDGSQIPDLRPSEFLTTETGAPSFNHTGGSAARARPFPRAPPRDAPVPVPPPALTCTRASVRSSLMASSSLGGHRRCRQPGAPGAARAPNPGARGERGRAAELGSSRAPSLLATPPRGSPNSAAPAAAAG